VATVVVLFLLAVLWAWYLVTWLRGRTEHRNVNSISSFSKHLSVLERATPVSHRPSSLGTYAGGHLRSSAGAGMTLSEAHRRRRNVLAGLAGATGASLLLTLVAGGAFMGLFVLMTGVLGGYVVLLARSRALQVERADKVRYLHPGWDDESASWEDDWDAEWDDEEWDEAWDEFPAYAAGAGS
jgi:hypothetical protein